MAEREMMITVVEERKCAGRAGDEWHADGLHSLWPATRRQGDEDSIMTYLGTRMSTCGGYRHARQRPQ